LSIFKFLFRVVYLVRDNVRFDLSGRRLPFVFVDLVLRSAFACIEYPSADEQNDNDRNRDNAPFQNGMSIKRAFRGEYR